MADLALTKSPGFEDDLFALPTRELMEQTLRLLKEVAKGGIQGRPLEGLVSTGNLSDCCEIYFDSDNNQKPRYRIVYRLTPNEIRAARSRSSWRALNSSCTVFYRAWLST